MAGAGGSAGFCGDRMVEGSEECDDANDVPGDGCESDCTRSRNRVFVTSTTQAPSTLGGLSGADAICQARADAAGVAGTYVAWLAVTGVAASTRLGSARGWVRMDGRPFVDTIDDLVNRGPWYPIGLDEMGSDLTAGLSARFVTGTVAGGAPHSETCADWTGSGKSLVRGGMVDMGAINWTTFVSSDCTNDGWRLACFGVDHEEPVAQPSESGRLAFVSSTPFAVAGGIAAADAHCQSEATGSLPGTYKALLATTTAGASSRFDLSGAPWVRLDGVAVVESAADLASGVLLAPINLGADGSTSYFNHGVWTGASSPATPSASATESCGDWGATSGEGQRGRTNRSNPTWFADNTAACDSTSMLVYCLQE
jgi:cysteine-rich repeat protein